MIERGTARDVLDWIAHEESWLHFTDPSYHTQASRRGSKVVLIRLARSMIR